MSYRAEKDGDSTMSSPKKVDRNCMGKYHIVQNLDLEQNYQIIYAEFFLRKGIILL